MFATRRVYFLSIMIKCGLIRRKVVCGEMTTIILNDQCMLFKLEYELVNIGINQSKVNVLVENKLARRNAYFIKIGNKNILHFSKHPNNTTLVIFLQ